VSAGTLIVDILAAAFRQAYCAPEILGRVVANMRAASFGTIPLGALKRPGRDYPVSETHLATAA
jgi:hypothetical protein